MKPSPVSLRPHVEVWYITNRRPLRIVEEKRRKKEEETTAVEYNGLPITVHTGGRQELSSY